MHAAAISLGAPVWAVMVLACAPFGYAAEPDIDDSRTEAAIAENGAPGNAALSLDEISAKHWHSLGVAPAPQCSDAVLLRRVWIDLAGSVPPAPRAREFLADASPDKRAKLVDRLLASDAFAEQWSGILAELLTDERPTRHDTHDGGVLRAYLRDSLRADRPYREIARELIAGEGVSDSSGPANFTLRYDADPVKLTGAVAKKFLGVTLECAQCHDHPFARWTRNDFWGLAACFGRTKKLSDESGELMAIVDVRRGELEIDVPKSTQPDETAGNAQAEQDQEKDKAEKAPPEKRAVAPRLLDGTSLRDAGSRRAQLAAWLTGESNAPFAQRAVNLVWARLFSAPLYDEPSNGDAEEQALRRELLESLAAQHAGAGVRFKLLLRQIVLSRLYSLEAAAPASSGGDGDSTGHRQLRLLARFPVRPLSTDEVYRSVEQATGFEGGYEEERSASGEIESDPYADPAVELLSERPLTVQRSLALLNSEYVHEAARMAVYACRAAVDRGNVTEEFEHLFLATLSRLPTGDEARTMLTLVRESPRPLQGLEDVVWTILNSAEFNTNH